MHIEQICWLSKLWFKSKPCSSHCSSIQLTDAKVSTDSNYMKVQHSLG